VTLYRYHIQEGRPTRSNHTLAINADTGWRWKEIQESPSRTGRYAALDSVVPYQAYLSSDLYSASPNAYEHRRSELLIALRDSSKATSLCPNGCSVHMRSGLLYDPTTAVSLRYAVPFYLCGCVYRQRSSNNTHSACRSLNSDLSILCYASWFLSSAMPAG
jgi:hypothetical protein